MFMSCSYKSTFSIVTEKENPQVLSRKQLIGSILLLKKLKRQNYHIV